MKKYALLGCLFCGAGLLAVIAITRQNPPPLTDAQRAVQEDTRTVVVYSKLPNESLQAIIRDVYHAETKFVRNDLVQVTFAPGSREEADAQGFCQAIANVWASRSGLPLVRVESWRGSQRLAQATVKDGQIKRP